MTLLLSQKVRLKVFLKYLIQMMSKWPDSMRVLSAINLAVIWRISCANTTGPDFLFSSVQISAESRSMAFGP